MWSWAKIPLMGAAMMAFQVGSAWRTEHPEPFAGAVWGRRPWLSAALLGAATGTGWAAAMGAQWAVVAALPLAIAIRYRVRSAADQHSVGMAEDAWRDTFGPVALAVFAHVAGLCLILGPAVESVEWPLEQATLAFAAIAALTFGRNWLYSLVQVAIATWIMSLLATL